MSTDSLLPDNRTGLEYQLEQTLADQLQQLDSPWPTLWNPATIPHRLLPWLAQAKGVEDWQGDSEQARRDTVASIWQVQRLAGTRAALKQAVEGLGFKATIEAGEQPYQLRIYAELEQLWHYENLQQRLLQRVMRAKSERDEIQLALRVKFDCPLHITAVGRLQQQRALQARSAGRNHLSGQQARMTVIRTGPVHAPRRQLQASSRHRLSATPARAAVLRCQPWHHHQGLIS